MNKKSEKMVDTIIVIMVRLVALFAALMYMSMPIIARAAAQDLAVTPVVIDEKGKPRDILKETLHLINTSDHLLEIYVDVTDTDTQTGAGTFNRAHGADELARSFANWVELSRGEIKLMPGEEKDVPFIIRIDPGAQPGDYHASIPFYAGSTRDYAIKGGALATVTLNLLVQADVKEIMQVDAFSADSIVFTGDDVLFKYQLKNVGNTDQKPAGEVRIYDRAGHEVASVDINREGRIISPDQVSQLASAWSAVQGFGRFKAMLDVKYGQGQVASVQDVTYFWVIPWKQLAMMLSIGTLAILALAFYFHRWLEERHFGKLAAAGLLKAEALVHVPHLSPAGVPGSVKPVATVSPPAPAKEKKKWRIFGFFGYFKYFAYLNPLRLLRLFKRERTIIEATPTVPPPVPPAPPQREAQSGTIDLKHMNIRAKHDEWQVTPGASQSPAEHGVVINLKNKS